jgi:adenylate kinase
LRFQKSFESIYIKATQEPTASNLVEIKKGEYNEMKAIIFGPPGSGKGTYASRLQAQLGVDVVAMGDIFREIMKEDTQLGNKVKQYVEKGLLVPDNVVIEVLKQRLAKTSKSKGFILDGFPRTIEQAKALEGIVPIDVVIQLDVPDWIIIERLSTRRICKNCGEIYNIRHLKPKKEGVCDKCGGQLYQRSDDTSEVIKERIGVYERQTQPILQYYKERKIPKIEFKCKEMDKPPEVAVESVVKDMKRLKLVQ